jgi:hypothetical protein
LFVGQVGVWPANLESREHLIHSRTHKLTFNCLVSFTQTLLMLRRCRNR